MIAQGGLSSETLAAIYGGVVGGVLGITGAVLATFVQNWLQRLGKIRGVIISHGQGTDVNQPGNTRFTAEVAFYNDKPLRIGIREPYLVYLKAGEPVGSVHFRREGEVVPIRFLDLPPREWVNLRGESSRAEPAARRMAEADNKELTWWLPSGKRETREPTGDWDVSRVRRFASRVAEAYRVLRGR
jgi:hypothetical protein